MLGTILYVALLLINAMAVLSEDRFLARSILFFLGSFDLVSNIWLSSRLVYGASSKRRISNIWPGWLWCNAGARGGGWDQDKTYWTYQRCTDSNAKCVSILFSDTCSDRFSVPL